MPATQQPGSYAEPAVQAAHLVDYGAQLEQLRAMLANQTVRMDELQRQPRARIAMEWGSVVLAFLAGASVLVSWGRSSAQTEAIEKLMDSRFAGFEKILDSRFSGVERSLTRIDSDIRELRSERRPAAQATK